MAGEVRRRFPWVVRGPRALVGGPNPRTAAQCVLSEKGHGWESTGGSYHLHGGESMKKGRREQWILAYVEMASRGG